MKSTKVCQPYLLKKYLIYEICTLIVTALVQSLINFCQDHYIVHVKYLLIVIYFEKINELTRSGGEESDRKLGMGLSF